jgi:DNA repair protein RadC
MKKKKNYAKYFELKKVQSEFPNITITNSEDSATFIRQFFGDDIDIFESFFILLLNRSNRTIGYAKISQGGITGTMVDIRLIAKYAIESLAVYVILAHNHPSGNTKPSKEDTDLTFKVRDALKLLDITILDHIILTKDKYLSFVDEGYI